MASRFPHLQRHRAKPAKYAVLTLGFGAPRDIVGLAMYAASRAAQCAYCSAHSCSFALRRGAPSASVAGLLAGDAEPRACAAIAVAVRDNFDPATSVIGLPLKARLGRVYAEAVDDAMLADAAENLAQRLARPTPMMRAPTRRFSSLTPPPSARR